MLSRMAPSSPPDMRTLDRKSTRLNSSHRCISYAVFCLKKKHQIELALVRSGTRIGELNHECLVPREVIFDGFHQAVDVFFFFFNGVAPPSFLLLPPQPPFQL